MITIVSKWDYTWFEPKIELALWKQICGAYGVDRLVMTPKKLEFRTCVDQYDSMKDALETCDGEIIIMEHIGGESLTDFIHPENAVYVFGNSMHGGNKRQQGSVITIPTPNKIDLFATGALSIVMADRYSKI